MNPLITLLYPILSGEPYRPPSESNSRLWISVFAVTPFTIALTCLDGLWFPNASLFVIWLRTVFIGLAHVGLWIFAFRHFSIRQLLVIATIAWSADFAAAFYLNRY